MSFDGSPENSTLLTCNGRPILKNSRNESPSRRKRFIYFVGIPPADQLQPKLHKREYTKPGDALPFRTPLHLPYGNRGKLAFRIQNYSTNSLMYTVWTGMLKSRTILFEYNERGHQTYRVLELSAETGQVQTIIEEKPHFS